MFAALLDHYTSKGGKDLGEFLMGSRARADVQPLPEPSHVIGNFDGVMAQVGGTFPALCKALGGMKGSSLKRMIGDNHMDKGDVIAKVETGLGIEQGSKADAQFWHLARGDKSLPDVDTLMHQAQNAMRRKDANPQAVARELALKLFERSGYTWEKYSALSGKHFMIKEISRHETYKFLPDRAEVFAKAILPGEPEKAEHLQPLLLGLDQQRRPSTLAAEVEHGEASFADLLKRLRAQRRETQAEMAENFAAFMTQAGTIVPTPEVTRGMIDKLEHGQYRWQSRAEADAFGAFLKLPEGEYKLVPSVAEAVPVEKRVTKDAWLAKIRGEEVTFKDYIRTLLTEEGISQEAFGKTVPYEGHGVPPDRVAVWLKGKRANTPHAEALAVRGGFAAGAEQDDFMAFARTGKLHRSDAHEMLKKLVAGELPLAEFVYQLRSEEGMTPEEFDQKMGMNKGASRNMESGRELYRHHAEAFAHGMTMYDATEKAAFQNRLVTKCHTLGESHRGFDPEGYCKMVEQAVAHCEVQNLRKLRLATSGARFGHHDPVVETCWRALVAEQSAAMAARGTVPKYLNESWNDMHDLLFSEVNHARLTSKQFRGNVESVMQYLGTRDDEGAARRFMTASIIRKHNADPEQYEFLALLTTLLNMKFALEKVHQAVVRHAPQVDEADAWGKVQELIKSVVSEHKLSKFGTIDAYLKTVIKNAVVDISRKESRRHSVNFADDVMANMEQASVRDADPLATKASDVVAALQAFKDALSPTDAALLDAVMSANVEERGLYERISGELSIPPGTVRSRMSHLRASLAQNSQLVEMLGDLFGTDYAASLVSRAHKSDGAGSDGCPGSR